MSPNFINSIAFFVPSAICTKVPLSKQALLDTVEFPPPTSDTYLLPIPLTPAVS